jgi:hypothetical protein
VSSAAANARAANEIDRASLSSGSLFIGTPRPFPSDICFAPQISDQIGRKIARSPPPGRDHRHHHGNFPSRCSNRDLTPHTLQGPHRRFWLCRRRRSTAPASRSSAWRAGHGPPARR